MIQTFDIDWERLPNGVIVTAEEKLDRVIKCLGLFGCIEGWRIRRSASGNGFHVEATSLTDCSGCDLCRLVLDSPKRLEEDLKQPVAVRGVLWDRKSYFKRGHWYFGEAGEWSIKKNII